MKCSVKIVELRKSKGMSQEELAVKLNVSRQTISRWEMESAMPDANNLLQLSKLFHVTSDYLLNDDYTSDEDLVKIKEMKVDYSNQVMFYLIMIEVMTLLIQFMAVFILQNVFFVSSSILLFIAPLIGFEYAYQKKAMGNHHATAKFRQRFYKISAWLGCYFPIRFLVMIWITLYPQGFSSLIFECIVLILYVCTALLVNLAIDKNDIK